MTKNPSTTPDTPFPGVPLNTPLYRDVKRQLMDALSTGEWKPGDAVPAERRLAERYGISIGTVRRAIDDSDLMDEALVEHAGAKDLITQLEHMDADDDLYDAKVTVLGEQIEHHVKEEEGDMFPKAKRAKVDTAALGAKMLTRKSELKAQMGIEDDESSAKPAKRKSGAK